MVIRFLTAFSAVNEVSTRMRNCQRAGIAGSLLLLVVMGLSLAGTATAADPTTKAECLSMMRAPLEAQCRKLFATSEQAEQQAACFGAVVPQVESVCEQFFGAGRDFCSTCTSSCTKNYEAGKAERRQCLSMCLAQPGCQ